MRLFCIFAQVHFTVSNKMQKTIKNINYKLLKRKLISSYFSSTLSISLVMLLTGLIILLLLNTNYLSSLIKEQIEITITLKDQASDADNIQLQKQLDLAPFVKETRYVSKEEAADLLIEELGDDFVEFLGYNPLFASIELKISSEYGNIDSLETLKHKLLENPVVEDFYYHKIFVKNANRIIEKISTIILVIIIILLFIALVLINNLIRMQLYSRRFSLRTMQLVGATKSFIIKPFIIYSILQALISALISTIVLLVIIAYFSSLLDGVFQIHYTGLTVFCIFAVSIIILSGITYFTIQNYLKTDIDKLYI